MSVIRFIRNTGIWAPVVVLILHELLHSREWRDPIDWFNHFCGGLSFSFFAWKSMPLLYRWFGTPNRLGRLAVAFLSGCTAALIWEIYEFLSDTFLHTHIQRSVAETMTDIVNGFLGTCTTIALLIFFCRQSATSHPSSTPET